MKYATDLISYSVFLVVIVCNKYKPNNERNEIKKSNTKKKPWGMEQIYLKNNERYDSEVRGNELFVFVID